MNHIMSFHKKMDIKILREIESYFENERQMDAGPYGIHLFSTENELKAIEKKIYEIYRLCLRDYSEEVFEAYIFFSGEADMFWDVSVEDFQESYYGEFECIDDFIDDYLEDNGIEVDSIFVLNYEDMWQESFPEYGCYKTHFFRNNGY